MLETNAPPADCPTPRKMRFMTRSAAKRSAAYRSRSTGFPLYVYKCNCKSWHMTRQRQELTDAPETQIHGVPHALGMTDDAFQNAVINDVMCSIAPDDAQFLRHIDVIDRWYATLVKTRKQAEAELTELRKLRNPSAEDAEWRDMLKECVDLVDARQRECAELRRVRDVVPAKPTPPTYVSPERAQLRQLKQAAAQSEYRLTRRTAGDRAIGILVDRHRAEFNEIYTVEGARAGLDLKWFDEDEPVDVAFVRDQDPPGVTPEYRDPRLPDAHLVITGEETFDEAANLLIGAVYRHLREHEDANVASRAVRDLVLQIERVQDIHRNIRSIAYIAHDWLTLHV